MVIKFALGSLSALSQVRALLDHHDLIGILPQRDEFAGIQSPLPCLPSLPAILDRIRAQFRARSCLQLDCQAFYKNGKLTPRAPRHIRLVWLMLRDLVFGSLRTHRQIT